MELFQPCDMLPLRWLRYSEYAVAPLSIALSIIDPVNQSKILERFQSYLKKAGLGTTKKSRDAIMAKELIYPAPGACDADYDAWESIKNVKCFQEFADVYRKKTSVGDSALLKWIHKYGLPYNDLNSSSLMSTKSPKSMISGSPLQDTLLVSRCLISSIQECARFSNATSLFKWRGVVLKDTFLELSREADAALTVFRSCKENQFLEKLDSSLMYEIMGTPFPFANDRQIDYWRKNNTFSSSDTYEQFFPRVMNEANRNVNDPMRMAGFLKDIFDARLSGINMTLMWDFSKNTPPIRFGFAFQAPDLLSVMWARFFSVVVSENPIGICPCGKTFQKKRKNQVYCDSSCQNRINQEHYRSHKKRKALSNLNTSTESP